MTRPIIRPATLKDASQLGKIQVTSWRSAFRGIAPDEYLDRQISEENQVSDWQEILADHEQIVVVAEINAEVVGYAWAHAEDNPKIAWEAELISMHLLPAFKRQGLGRELFSAAATQLQKQGCHSAYLWVLEENQSAREFYVALGGKPSGTHQVELGGKSLIEVAYSWQNISDLIR